MVGGSGLLLGVTVGGSGLIIGVTVGGSGLMRGVTFGGWWSHERGDLWWLVGVVFY